ncbi:MAG TPA: NAD kinase [Firmicutes bacterium]|nr:NAD kinase [Bacillota bacterium]
MKIAIYNNEADVSLAVAKQLKQKLLQEQVILDENNPDIVVTIGGDGTVLKAVHHYQSILDKVKFIGIHTGHLGYYTDWLPDELDELITFLRTNNSGLMTYPLLAVSVYAPEGVKQFMAFNEMTILNAYRTQHLNVTIDGLFFESFRGTGVCISTPTGSTAYNKSLGGAIIFPSLSAFQMTEIGSLNNNVYRTIGSSLVIPSNHVITLESESFEGATVTRDHLYDTFDDIHKIEVTLSKQSVSFIKRHDVSFWARVKDNFL